MMIQYMNIYLVDIFISCVCHVGSHIAPATLTPINYHRRQRNAHIQRYNINMEILKQPNEELSPTKYMSQIREVHENHPDERLFFSY